MAINFARMGDEENLSRVQKDLTVELELTPQLTERILEIEERKSRAGRETWASDVDG